MYTILEIAGPVTLKLLAIVAGVLIFAPLVIGIVAPFVA